MKKKLLSLCAMITTCCLLLTGCMGEIVEGKINEDGSGKLTASVGLTESAMAMFAAMGEEMDSEEYVPFTYNGKTYYGETESVEFKSIDEFNELMAGLEDSDDFDTGMLSLEKDSNGYFVFTVVADPGTGDTSELESEMEYYEEMMSSGEMETTTEFDAEAFEVMMQDMAIVFSFEFPRNIKQISGINDGVTVEGNKVTLDFIAMGNAVTEKTIFRFTTDMNAEFKNVEHLVEFEDVNKNAWYYEAVQAMADGGLVAGIGNNQFAPENTLTRAQFYQILARALNLSTGTENGYWAATAIRECIYMGFVLTENNDVWYDEIVINQKEWDVPITREEAVSAMYLAYEYANDYEDSYDGEVKISVDSLKDIPDSAEISDVYADTILNAFNAGITSGVDSNKTFVPKGLLTRAQGCQLFYNLGWTSPR